MEYFRDIFDICILWNTTFLKSEAEVHNLVETAPRTYAERVEIFKSKFILR